MELRTNRINVAFRVETKRLAIEHEHLRPRGGHDEVGLAQPDVEVFEASVHLDCLSIGQCQELSVAFSVGLVEQSRRVEVAAFAFEARACSIDHGEAALSVHDDHARVKVVDGVEAAKYVLAECDRGAYAVHL